MERWRPAGWLCGVPPRAGERPRERFTYRVALVNGTGTAQLFDFNQKKDLVGRVQNLGTRHQLVMRVSKETVK